MHGCVLPGSLSLLAAWLHAPSFIAQYSAMLGWCSLPLTCSVVRPITSTVSGNNRLTGVAIDLVSLVSMQYMMVTRQFLNSLPTY